MLIDFEYEAHLALIQEAARECGYDARRIDRDHTDTAIVRKIVESIAESELIVADLSGSNPNVLYELGIAHTMQRRVLLVVDAISRLPFDLQGYPVSVIDATRRDESVARLTDEIRSRASARAGGGPIVDKFGRFAIRYGEPLFLRRATAFAIDSVLALSPLWLAIWPMIGTRGDFVPTLAMLAWLFVYFFVATWLFAATPGKAALGLKVETWDGRRVGPLRAAARTIGYGLSWLPLGAGFWIAAFGPAYMTFHDRISRTRVVRRARP